MNKRENRLYYYLLNFNLEKCTSQHAHYFTVNTLKISYLEKKKFLMNKN
jgi:hypothetical protein